MVILYYGILCVQSSSAFHMKHTAARSGYVIGKFTFFRIYCAFSADEYGGYIIARMSCYFKIVDHHIGRIVVGSFYIYTSSLIILQNNVGYIRCGFINTYGQGIRIKSVVIYNAARHLQRTPDHCYSRTVRSCIIRNPSAFDLKCSVAQYTAAPTAVIFTQCALAVGNHSGLILRAVLDSQFRAALNCYYTCRLSVKCQTVQVEYSADPIGNIDSFSVGFDKNYITCGSSTVRYGVDRTLNRSILRIADFRSGVFYIIEGILAAVRCLIVVNLLTVGDGSRFVFTAYLITPVCHAACVIHAACLDCGKIRFFIIIYISLIFIDVKVTSVQGNVIMQLAAVYGKGLILFL